MLRAHSILWHYLWVGPNLLLLLLAMLSWRRQLQKQFPVFVFFAFATAIEQLAMYAADVTPYISAVTFWKIVWTGFSVEALVKFALIGEIFGRVFGQYRSIARLGRLLASAVGVILVFVAATIAAYTPKNNPYWIVSGAHLLEQTIYMIECGIIVFFFLLTTYFKLRWPRRAFGIVLGLGVSASVHLATWALMANGDLIGSRSIFLVFANMAAYHLCVLIWLYYLLVPQKSVVSPVIPVPEHNNLELWNRELERLLQQ